MIANGLFHLFLYRLIYYYIVPSPLDVYDAGKLFKYLISSYLLIVRLAGLIHLSAGFVCIFGFWLPRPFEHYFFAHSFTDIWRRINIYWRDFISKVFSYPIYFRLKRLGTARGIFISTLIVFGINWFLHGWQWFWIRGQFLISATDIIFWILFGLSVAVNSLIELRKHRRTQGQNGFSFLGALKGSAQITGMFLTMTLLWSFWTTPSIVQWFSLVGVVRESNAMQWFTILMVIGLAICSGIFILWLQYRNPRWVTEGILTPSSRLNLCLAGFGLGCVLGIPQVFQPIAETLRFDPTPILHPKLNEHDRSLQFKGYYETLLVGNNLNSRMWELEQKKPDDWQQLGNIGVGIRRDDIMLKELKPNQKVNFKNCVFTTNSLGLRDREYPVSKPKDVIRIALLGGSIEMGSGVNTMETYENVTENAINDRALFGKGLKVEILNFGISGNHLFQNLAAFETKAAPLNPDIVIYTAHSDELNRIVYSFYKGVGTGRDLKYPFLEKMADSLKLERGIPEEEFRKRLKNNEMKLALEGYQYLADMAKASKTKAIWMYIPTLDESSVPGEREKLRKEALKMGFHVIDLSDAFNGMDLESMKVAPWDTHPNKDGHQAIAREWTRVLEANPTICKKLASL